MSSCWNRHGAIWRQAEILSDAWRWCDHGTNGSQTGSIWWKHGPREQSRLFHSAQQVWIWPQHASSKKPAEGGEKKETTEREKEKVCCYRLSPGESRPYVRLVLLAVFCSHSSRRSSGKHCPKFITNSRPRWKTDTPQHCNLWKVSRRNRLHNKLCLWPQLFFFSLLNNKEPCWDYIMCSIFSLDILHSLSHLVMVLWFCANVLTLCLTRRLDQSGKICLTHCMTADIEGSEPQTLHAKPLYIQVLYFTSYQGWLLVCFFLSVRLLLDKLESKGPP